MEKRERGKLKTGPWGWIHFLDILECSGPLSLIWTLAQEIITSLLKTIHFVFPIQLMTMRTENLQTLHIISSALNYSISVIYPKWAIHLPSSYKSNLYIYIQSRYFLRSRYFRTLHVASYFIFIPWRRIHFLGEGTIILSAFIKTLLLSWSLGDGMGNLFVVLYFINWIFEDTNTNYRLQL